MATLIKAKAKGKFRPCRSDIPKRKVLYADDSGNLATGQFAYGERIPGLKLLSAPSAQCYNGAVVRSGIGTAHHLRRFPVYVTAPGRHDKGERTAAITHVAQWIADNIPDSKPKVLDGNRIKVVLWADEAKFVRENIRGNYRVRED